jgi:hypothetical protein
VNKKLRAKNKVQRILTPSGKRNTRITAIALTKPQPRDQVLISSKSEFALGIIPLNTT